MTLTAQRLIQRANNSRQHHLCLYQVQGFTLIELLFVTVIMGIIMVTGTAAYSNYSKQIEDEYGKIFLEDVIARQKSYFIHNRSYTLSPQALGYAAGALKSEKNLFEISIAVCNGDTITRCVQATARPLTTTTTGTIFSRDTRGNRTPIDGW